MLFSGSCVGFCMNTDPYYGDARSCQAFCGHQLWCGALCGVGGANNDCGSSPCTNKCRNVCGSVVVDFQAT